MRKAAQTRLSLKRTALAALAFAALALSVSRAADDNFLPDAPIDHFRVFGFDKVSGWRSWQLEGAKAEFPADGSVRVSDMRLRIYEASDRQIVNMLIESPMASMPRSKDYIGGPSSIVMNAKGVFLGGENWTWQPEQHRLIIRKHTHAVIDGEVGPILE
jgi:hypothetical protein